MKYKKYKKQYVSPLFLYLPYFLLIVLDKIEFRVHITTYFMELRKKNQFLNHFYANL